MGTLIASINRTYVLQFWFWVLLTVGGIFALSAAPLRAEEGLDSVVIPDGKFPEGAPKFLDALVHPAIRAEGAYLLEIDTPIGQSRMLLSLTKGGDFTDTEDQRAVYTWMRDPEAPWQILTEPTIIGHPPLSGPYHGPISETARNLSVSDGGEIRIRTEVLADLPAKHLSIDYTLVLRPEGSDFNSFEGEWFANEGGENEPQGLLRMQRLVPRWDRIEFSGIYSTHNNASSATTYDVAAPGTRPLRLVLPEGLKEEFQPNVGGNRPRARVKIFGTGMWWGDWDGRYLWVPEETGLAVKHAGLYPIRVQEDGRPDKVIGQQFFLELSSRLTEGQHTVYVNGFPITLEFDFAWTDEPEEVLAPDALEVIDEKGEPLDHLTDGHRFKLRAKFPNSFGKEVITAQIPPDGTAGSTPILIGLRKTSSADGYFESELLAFMSTGNGRAKPQHSPDGQLDSGYTEHFEGKWRVDGLAGAEDGRAEIRYSEGRVHLTLGTEEFPRSFRSRALLVEDTVAENRPAVRLRATLEASTDASDDTNEINQPSVPARYLNIEDSRDTLSFKIGEDGEPLTLPIRYRSAEEDITVELVRFDGSEVLLGEMYEPAVGLRDAVYASQTWTRDTPMTIRKVVNIVNQMQLEPFPNSQRNATYPYDELFRPTAGEPRRALVIIGSNLPSPEEAKITSDDFNIEYSRVLELASDNTMRDDIYRLLEEPFQTDEEMLLVQADLLETVQPGPKQLILNGAPAPWHLAFADARGTIRILREGSVPSDLPENTFYANETISVGVESFLAGMPLQGLELMLEAVKPEAGNDTQTAAPRPIGTVPLHVYPHYKRRMAISDALVVNIVGISEPDTHTRDTIVELAEGERLRVRLVDPPAFASVPAEAEILPRPRRTRLWQTALNRVGSCPDVTGDPRRIGFAAEVGYKLSDWMFAEFLSAVSDGEFARSLNSRTLSLSNGDHAALLLIRDELIPMIRKDNDALRPYLEGDREYKALKYLGNAKNLPHGLESPFWTYYAGEFRFADTTNPEIGTPIFSVSYKLAETANLPALRDKINAAIDHQAPSLLRLDLDRTREMALKTISARLQQQYENTNEALSRIVSGGDCDVEALLAFSGHNSARAVVKILPDLVKPAGSGWQPDRVARGYVKSVHVGATAITAQNDYASLDDATLALAISGGATALAGTGVVVTAAVSSKIGSGLMAASLLGNLGESVYLGGKDYLRAVQAEEDYRTAVAVSSVTGEDVIRAAEDRRSSVALAALGVVAPALGTLADVATIRKIQNIGKGRVLVRQSDALNRLDDLSDSERINVAAYYDHLQRTHNSRAGALLPKQREDLAALDNLVNNRARHPIPKDIGPVVSNGDDVAGLPAGKNMEGPVPQQGAPAAEGVEVPVAKAGLPNAPARAPPPDMFDDEFIAGTQTYAKQVYERLELHPRLASTAYTDAGSFADADGRRWLNEHAVIVRKSDNRQIRLGRILGNNSSKSDRSVNGTFSRVYTNPDDPNTVYKVRRIPLKGEKGPSRGVMRSVVFDSEIGHNVLSRASRGSDVYEVPTRSQAFQVESRSEPGVSYVITMEQNIAAPVRDASGNAIQINGKAVNVTNYEARIEARDTAGLADDAEMQRRLAEDMTLRLAVDDLNKQGVFWSDAKWSNYDIIPDDTARTGYRVRFFDLDGFRIVKTSDLEGLSPSEFSVTIKNRAARAQAYLDNFHDRNAYVLAGRGATLVDAVTDYRIFNSLPIDPPVTADPAKLPRHYIELGRRQPADLKRLFEEMFPGKEFPEYLE